MNQGNFKLTINTSKKNRPTEALTLAASSFQDVQSLID